MMISKFLDPKNDVAFRKIFGTEEHKDILIHFINDILERKDDEIIKEVEFLSPIQNPEIAIQKESILDILCKDEKGTMTIVEMQVAPMKGFEKRAQYYAAKAYSRQLHKGQNEDGKYANLKEVIFIAICDNIVFPDKQAYKSDHVILDRETYEHDLQDFSFTFVELPKFKKEKIEDLENIVEKWCYFFKHASDTTESDVKKIIDSDMVINRAYEVLNRFNWNEKELIAYEYETKRIADNRAAARYQQEIMEERLQAAQNKGREQGIAEGIAEGIAQGIEKGREEGMVEGMLQLNADLNDIARITGLSLDAIKAIAYKFKK